ncbi:HutD/Ves family protein [Pacificibacter marinus]|uniref:HutD/Ves family protein n=1 Tax=Pacificibacter marinus TaxID=658057 RepID=UPI001C0736A7|nr:HutD family protein [Pacificibacter marinus]MBU2865777.1 HutD family protein [Pacificibacter marinus]
MQVLAAKALIDVPWKNGGGITRNIAKGLLGTQAVWTVSRADVAQNGPFSDFAGMRRILTVVSGGGMKLTGPNLSLDASLWRPVIFDGGIAIESHLTAGPLTDLNLMFDPTLCEGVVTVHKEASQHAIQTPEHGIVILHGLAGAPKIDGTALGVSDTAFVTATNAVVDLARGDALFEICLSYMDQSAAIKLAIADR